MGTAVNVAMLASDIVARSDRSERHGAAERAHNGLGREAVEERAKGWETGAYDREGRFD